MPQTFRKKLLAWHDQHGRHDLPWQTPRDTYRVWLSEVMLQQTQVATVIPYFKRFIERFPDIHSLAAASIDELLTLWAGLGYYSRAKNLHRTAKILCADTNGVFPNTVEGLIQLPGIGRSTAGAILAQAFNQFGVILDGNVRRVLIRVHALHGEPTSLQDTLWELAKRYTPPQKRQADYAQAIMDLGALICTRSKPKCLDCPLNQQCLAYSQGSTDLLPTKRNAKSKPLKTTLMLVIRDSQQRILLFKRPLSGLWNGLWCLPSLDHPSHLDSWLTKLQLKAKQQSRLPSFRHVFSHFALDIDCLLIDVNLKKSWQIREEPNQQWFDKTQALALGIPAPIKKILSAHDI